MAIILLDACVKHRKLSFLLYTNTNQHKAWFLVLGKIEGQEFNEDAKDWHGHVSAVTVAP